MSDNQTTENLPTTPAEQEADAQSTVDRILALNRRIDLQLPEESEDLWKMVVEFENASALLEAKRGFAYLLLKERLGHGAFLAELERHDIAPRRAQEAMKVAHLVMRLPKEKARSIAHLGSTRLMELARIPPEAFDEAQNQGELDIDEIATMSTREVREYARKLKRDHENEKLGRRNAVDELNKLKGAGNPKPAGSDYPASVVRARMESSALSDQAIACLQSIDQLVRGIQTATDLGGETLERQANIKAAVAPLALNVQAVGDVLDELLAYLRDQFEPYLPSSIDDTPYFAEADRKQIRSMRDSMLQLLDTDKKSRNNAREISGQQKRGRGRPSKAV